MNKRKQGPQHFGDVEKDRKPCVPCVWYGPAFPLANVPKIVTKQGFYAVNLYCEKDTKRKFERLYSGVSVKSYVTLHDPLDF